MTIQGRLAELIREHGYEPREVSAGHELLLLAWQALERQLAQREITPRKFCNRIEDLAADAWRLTA